MSKALIKLAHVKHPISEETIGFRLKAAHPNLAGRNFKGQAIPSFAKKYLILESSDFSKVEEGDLKRFYDTLREFHRFTEFEVVSVAS